jgi:hypothetical protein
MGPGGHAGEPEQGWHWRGAGDPQDGRPGQNGKQNGSQNGGQNGGQNRVQNRGQNRVQHRGGVRGQIRKHAGNRVGNHRDESDAADHRAGSSSASDRR